MKKLLLKVVPLGEARARLSQLVSEVEEGRGSVANARRSQVKVVLVSAKRFCPGRRGACGFHLTGKRSRLGARAAISTC